jgi:hypothetical protein
VEAERRVGGEPRIGRLLGAIFIPSFFTSIVTRARSIATEEGSEIGLVIITPEKRSFSGSSRVIH